MHRPLALKFIRQHVWIYWVPPRVWQRPALSWCLITGGRRDEVITSGFNLALSVRFALDLPKAYDAGKIESHEIKIFSHIWFRGRISYALSI